MNPMILLGLTLCSCAAAQPAASVQEPAPKVTTAHSATTPVPRTEEGILARQAEVLKRAQESPPCNVVFLGDSITQGWEGMGQAAWNASFAPLGALNLGVSGDRTEHVLWRLQQAPLGRLQPKCVVLLIGTNNLGHGTSTGLQTLEGVQHVVATIHAQLPAATILVQEIFPRGETFNPMRGEIAQINQVLRSQARGEDAPYHTLATGDRWVGADGAIAAAIMPDFLHLSAEGYEQWAADLAPAVVSALR